MYEGDGGEWVPLGTLNVGAAMGDRSGYAVALSASGRVVVVSSYLSDITGTNSGALHVYVWSGDDWVQRGVVTAGELAGDRFGFALSLSSGSSVLAVGAQCAHFTATADSGHARVFNLSGAGTVFSVGLGTGLVCAGDWYDAEEGVLRLHAVECARESVCELDGVDAGNVTVRLVGGADDSGVEGVSV